jgi:hypothetical protein
VGHTPNQRASARRRHLTRTPRLLLSLVAAPTTTFTAVDDHARHQLQEVAAALRAGRMNVSDVLSIVNATVQG